MSTRRVAPVAAIGQWVDDEHVRVPAEGACLEARRTDQVRARLSVARLRRFRTSAGPPPSRRMLARPARWWCLPGVRRGGGHAVIGDRGRGPPRPSNPAV